MLLIYSINIYAYFALINLFFCTVFGFLVLFHNTHKRLYQTFFLMNLAIALWSIGYFFWQISDNANDAMFWVRILSIGSTLIPPFFLHWYLSLLNLHKKRKIVLIFFYSLSVVFLLFSFSNLFISGVSTKIFFKYWPDPGPLYSIYLFISYLPIFLYGNYLIVKKYKSSLGIEKSRLRWVMVGSVLSSLGAVTNFPLWYNIPLPPVGNFLVASYPIFFSYSITRYRFMDIRSVINRSLTFGILTLTIMTLFASLSSIVGLLFVGLIGPKSNIIIGLIVGLLLSVTYLPFRHFIERSTDKFFYKRTYVPGTLLSQISEVTSSILDLNALLASISKTLEDAFHFEKAGIVLMDKNDKMAIAYKDGFKPGVAEGLVSYPNIVKILYQELEETSGIMVIDEMQTKFDNGEFKPVSPELLNALHVNDIALIIPLFVQEKLIGVIALGNKKSGDAYNNQDLGVLKIIAGQSAIAIENARLYDELKDFNTKLEEEVRKKTSQLRKANSQLRQLDAAKSEFISIASHQLRTPLTVIKGYISMMREGSFGPVPDAIMTNLEKVYISNERLINLVENLLDISRIESGRQEFNWAEVHVDKLAAGVVEELKNNAKLKGLALSFKQPTEPVPVVVADEGKLHEVVMNFVDNAIKYTKAGSVDVYIKNEPKGMVTFCVQDTGMGVSKEILPHLFHKFSRGKDSFRIHTEGVGLGLYVAKMLIDNHKGKIWVESEGEGKGSKFCFALPVKGPNSPQALPPLTIPKQATATSPDSPQKLNTSPASVPK